MSAASEESGEESYLLPESVHSPRPRPIVSPPMADREVLRIRINSSMSCSVGWETLSIFQLGFAFLTIFSAFNSAGFIQEGVLQQLANETATGGEHLSKGAGYTSLATIYAVFTVANLVASPLVGLLTAKWAMVAGAACYLLFHLTFALKVMEWSLYATSGILGFGAAILWTGQGTYMTQSSTNETIGRNSGITWALLQGCGICGGAFLFFFFPHSSTTKLEYSTVRVVYVVFAAVTGVGMVLLTTLRQPPSASAPAVQAKPDDTSDLVESVSERNPGVLDSVAASPQLGRDEVVLPPAQSKLAAAWDQTSRDFVEMLRMMKTRNIVTLIITFFFTGLETAFWTGVYATCLVNTAAFDYSNNVIFSVNAITIGVGQVIGGGLFGLLGHRTNVWGRSPIVVLGVLCHIAAYFLAFLTLPGEATIEKTSETAYWAPTIYTAYSVSFLLGFADACWNTQIYSLLGALYPDSSAPAFASYKLFQSLGATVSFVLSAKVRLQWQLLALVVSAAVAGVAFFPVEFRAAAQAHRRDQEKER